jgi:hypothetical protein
MIRAFAGYHRAMLFRCFLLTALMLATAAHAGVKDWVWFEAESAFASNFPKSNPFGPEDDRQRDVLSGGRWIGAQGRRVSPLFAVYDVDVPADGTYTLYARKFWKHGTYRWRFDQGPWVDVGRDIGLLDSFELRTHVVANWTSAGTVELKAGRRRLRIETTDADGAIAFDCFVLTSGRFTPRGVLTPDAPGGVAPDGWFLFEPPADDPASPISLRALNERFAGEHGFIRPRAGEFVREADQKPIRFWGVNAGPDIVRLSNADVDYLAKMLSQRGVNLVRLHGPVFFTDGPNIGQVDSAQVDRILYAVNAFKREGIYSTLSIYFPLWLRFDESNGWPGYKDQHPFALLFFDRKFQAIYKSWWQALLTRPDARTGVALKDEPAVLSIELINEDSLFFWTFTPYKNVPTPYIETLEKRFGAWMSERDGSIDATLKRWNTEKVRGDAPADGRLGFVELWRLFNTRDARSKDTARFMADLQRQFYADTKKWLVDEVGARSMISASNWTTASVQYLSPLERYSYLAGDFLDRHGYFAALHEGPRSSHMVADGDTYADRSALRFESEKPGESKKEFGNPFFDTQVDDHPTMLSEVDFSSPNRFRVEMPLFAASYAALNDLDAIGFFAITVGDWQRTLSKFAVTSPGSLGQYPAAALIYRHGLVSTGPVVADIRLNLKATLDLAGTPGGGEQMLDAVRASDIPPGHVGVVHDAKIDPRTRLVGRITHRLIDGPSETRLMNIARHILPDQNRVDSATGELSIDYGRGVLTLNAARAQGAVGALDAGPTRTTDLTISSAMPLGSIVAVSLDGLPIGESKSVLVQVMSEEQPLGFRSEGDVQKVIRSMGTGPMILREFEGVVTFNDGVARQVRPIAANGTPIEPATPSAVIKLRPDVLYYHVVR